MGWRTRVPDGCPLTNAQYEAMLLVATGKSTSVAASDLGIAASTVRAHVFSACKRLGVHSRVEAVIVLKDSGWLGAPPRQPNVPDPPLTHGQMLYLQAFDLLLKTRSREAEAAVTICFAAMCWEAGARPRRRVADPDEWLMWMAERLTARRLQAVAA